MRESTSERVAGGYVLVRAGQLLSVWEAVRTKIITPLDLRVWLACQELVARRCGAPKGTPVKYTPAEARALVRANSDGAVLAAVRRLTAAGLLHWSGEGITFPSGDVPECHGLSPHRLVPVPRRTLRFLAAGTTHSLTATMLGTLLRCAFYRRGVCSWTGACKASWVAEVFGLDERSVKRARAMLQQLGWLSTEAVPQWRLNRFGGMFRVYPDWHHPESNTRELSPPPHAKAPRLSPPESDQEPLRAYIHQEPAPSGPAGARGPLTKPPSLRDITPEDLQRRDRLLALHAEACRVGLAEPGEAGRLRFASLVARARRVATSNPGGMLAWLLREGRWNFITNHDEDRARAWLGEPGHGHPRREGGAPARAPVRIRSVVQALLEAHTPGGAREGGAWPPGHSPECRG